MTTGPFCDYLKASRQGKHPFPPVAEDNTFHACQGGEPRGCPTLSLPSRNRARG